MNLRGWGRIALLVVTLLVLIGPHLTTRLLGIYTTIPNLFLGLCARAVGLDIVVEGTPLKRDVLFVANHIGWMDILALGGAAKTAFVSKGEVADWPVIGWLADQNHTVYVRREDRRAVGRQADQVRDALAAGRPVALFPEGTTGPGTHLLRFHASLLAAAAPGPPHLAIQPVAVDYGLAASEIAWSDPESASDNAKRLLSRRRRTRLVLRFLDPLPATACVDRKTAAAAARTKIEGALFGWGENALPASAERL